MMKQCVGRLKWAMEVVVAGIQSRQWNWEEVEM
jgi:hypothetical protein